MDVAALEGMSLPGVRLRNRPTQVMPNQKRVKARRKRRKELVLIQICLFGGLLLVVKGFSYLAEHSGEDPAARSAGMPGKESLAPRRCPGGRASLPGSLLLPARFMSATVTFS